MSLDSQNVCDYLISGKDRDRIALLTRDGQSTYGDLRSIADEYAQLLLARGGRKGDRVLILADSGPFWAGTYLGILKAGLVCVPIPSKVSTEELVYIAGFTEPAFAFVEAKNKFRLAGLLPADRIIDDGVALFRKQVNSPQSIKGPATTRGDDLAALMFTSGSTGKPRGVMISHRNIISNTESIVQYLNLTSEDRVMAVLPFHYCFGTSLLHTHLRVGASLVIDSRFMYPEKILQRMIETECTGFAGVPSHFQILLRRSNFPKMQFPKLRYVQQAGGPLAPAFIRELQDALPKQQIFIMYGQTEATARLSYLPPDCLGSKLGSIGRGIPGVKLSVVNELGEDVRPGQVGEIVAEGENVALGYWRDERETADSFHHGKLYTGDLATVDEDGFIFIVDRAKDFLKCGGKRVSCRQLENVLLEHADVIEAAVVGVPDEILGEAAVAYVVPRDLKSKLTSDQLSAHCRRRVSPSFVPKRFVMLNALPKNSSGKVLKPALKSGMIAG